DDAGVIFVFASRRRHTRSKRDWSSDVCSSDLADEGNWNKTEKQFALFGDVISMIKGHGFIFPIRHAAGSTVTIERAEMHLDLVRPGIALFGYHPSPVQKDILPLTPVMQ